MRRALVALCVALALHAPALASGPAPVVSVGLVVHRASVEIGSTGTFQLYDGPSRDPGPVLSSPERVAITATGSGLRYLGHTTTAVALVPAAGAHVLVDGRPYRGRVDVRADRHGGLTVINVVDVESYLLGVVQSEMPASTPYEALKAQAVASRTYALKHREGPPDQGFGLRADEQSQVYGGVKEEDPRCTAAVEETRGVVLSNGGELLEASFHAACGGQTENNEDVWAMEPLSYQRAVSCAGCQRVPPPLWTVKLDLSVVATRLRREGVRVGQIRGIWALPSRTGRVRELVLQSDRGTVRVPGNTFRLAVDRRAVKSTLWNLEEIALAATSPAPGPRSDATARTAQTLTISGRGAGHGLGMCQHGAGVMAGMGATCAQILKTYYTGVTLARAY